MQKHYDPTTISSRRGFAAMDEEKQREIASKGGKSSPARFDRIDEEKQREIATKGGLASAERAGSQGMAERGRKGGLHSHSGSSPSTFLNDKKGHKGKEQHTTRLNPNRKKEDLD